jgi:hypothetical protein
VEDLLHRVGFRDEHPWLFVDGRGGSMFRATFLALDSIDKDQVVKSLNVMLNSQRKSRSASTTIEN